MKCKWGGVIKATVSDHITQQCYAQFSLSLSPCFLSPLLFPVLDGSLFLSQIRNTVAQHHNERDFHFVTSFNCCCDQ